MRHPVAIVGNRLERARAELERLKREAIDAETGASRFGPNCKLCRYSSAGADYCYHPAVQSVSVDWRGSVQMGGCKETRDMRDNDGLCGPESALFDRRQWFRRAPWFAIAGVLWAATWVAVGGFAVPLAMFGALGLMAEWMFGRWS